MNEYHYKLDRSAKKYICPGCNKKRFVKYLNSETGEYLPEKYGRCDRESNCGYHLNPYKTGYGQGEARAQIKHISQAKPQPQPVYFMPVHILDATLKHYDQNTFIKNLLKLAPAPEIEKIISLYRIGTISTGKRAGAVTFPFIDKAGNIRTIQVKQFDETNHTKEYGTDFIHSMLIRYYLGLDRALPIWLKLYEKNEKYVSCLFGEHLLNTYQTNPVALVEAPKTAIIGTHYYGLPENPKNLLWLAVYNKGSLNLEKCQALKGRNVILFPDLNAFDDWSQKIEVIKKYLPDTRFIISDILESQANENDKKNGLDLADYLTRFDWENFRLKICPLE